jgi:anti-sigma factor RsiW
MNCPMEPGGNPSYLLDYTSGKLKAEVRARMGEHLNACPACREFVQGQSMVWEALDSWEPAPVSLDFDRRLYERVEQQVSWWTRLTSPLNPLFQHAIPIGAAAAVLIMAGLIMNRPATLPSAPVQESAQVETLQPEQLEHAVDDMEMLRELNHLVPDTAAPRM